MIGHLLAAVPDHFDPSVYPVWEIVLGLLVFAAILAWFIRFVRRSDEMNRPGEPSTRRKRREWKGRGR